MECVECAKGGWKCECKWSYSDNRSFWPDPTPVVVDITLLRKLKEKASRLSIMMIMRVMK